MLGYIKLSKTMIYAKVIQHKMANKFSKKIKDKNEHLTGQQESTLPDARKSPFFIK